MFYSCASRIPFRDGVLPRPGSHRGRDRRGLAIVFGTLVALAGLSELTGWMRRVRWGRRSAWAAGAVSGALGTRLLGHLRQEAFRRVVGVLLVALGVYLVVAGRG